MDISDKKKNSPASQKALKRLKALLTKEKERARESEMEKVRTIAITLVSFDR